MFLYNHGLSPYDGGIFHQVRTLNIEYMPKSMLIVPGARTSLALLDNPGCWTIFAQLGRSLYATGSALCGLTHEDLRFRSRRLRQTLRVASQASQMDLHGCSSRVNLSTAFVMSGKVLMDNSYLFNPLIVLTCLGRPTSMFSTTFVLLATSKACSGSTVSSAVALALAAYNSLHPALLLPPLIFLSYDQTLVRRQTATKSASTIDTLSLAAFAIRHVLAFTLTTALLLGLSFAMTQSWTFLHAVYGTRLLLPDLTPNVGLWWYFFIEMFDSFRSFFLGVFWLHMAAYSPGLTIRLRRQPLAVVVLLCGIFSVFQPYANIGDAGVWMAMLALYGHVFERKDIGLRRPNQTTDQSCSHTIYFPSLEFALVHLSSWPSLLPSLDICWKRQRQLLLCDHTGVESWLCRHSS